MKVGEGMQSRVVKQFKVACIILSGTTINADRAFSIVAPNALEEFFKKGSVQILHIERVCSRWFIYVPMTDGKTMEKVYSYIYNVFGTLGETKENIDACIVRVKGVQERYLFTAW